MTVEEIVVKNPDMELAQHRFVLSQENQSDQHTESKRILMEAIKKGNMIGLYKDICTELNWPQDKMLVDGMQKNVDTKIKALDEAIQNAITNEGESEIKNSMLARAEYLVSIGDKEQGVKALNETIEKTISIGKKLDIIFMILRVGLFYMDHALISKNITKAHKYIDEGGDWDRRNRLKVYEGLYKMSIRDFSTAAKLFLATVSTFTSTELLDYDTFIFYTTTCCLLTLPRIELGKKVIKSPEVLATSAHKPITNKLMNCFYNCRYSEFFEHLAELEQVMKKDRYLFAHYHYYVREIRVAAYSQLLDSYSSVTLQSVSNSFNVSPEFIDKEFSRFISAGFLRCRIDKVNGIISNSQSNQKSVLYESTLREGDILINKLQKLSRVIDV